MNTNSCGGQEHVDELDFTLRETGQATSRRLHIGVVTQYFVPEKAPIPSSVPFGLSDRGHRVRIVTGFPNYPEGVLHPGYRQKFGTRESIKDMVVLRTPLFVSHSSNAFGRIINYVSFGFSALSGTRFLRKVDVNYVYATQMTAAIAPVLWSKFRGIPYVLHVQDLWPDSIIGSGMVHPGLAKIVSGILNPLIRFAYKNAAAVIGISNRMASVLVERGARPDRTFTLYNWAPQVPGSDGGPVPEIPQPSDMRIAKLKLIYAGNLGVMQDVGTLIDAMNLIRDLPVTLSVFGNGVQEDAIRSRADNLNLLNVEFFSSVSNSEIRKQYQKHDFQVVLLKKLPVFELTIPSKFQSGISCGLPLITAVHGELSDLTTKHEIGFVAQPESPEDLANAIRAALATTTTQKIEMRANAKALYAEQMSYESGMERLEEILQFASL